MTDLNRTALPSRTDGTVEKTDTLVVGAGQAGVAMSEHLSRLGVPHLVLERNRIAEAWRSGRWDSLVANGPAWHDRFPGMEFDIDPDGFPGKDQVAAYFEAYAKKFDAPIRTGVEVRKVVRNVGRPGFTVDTSAGTIEANRVVAATGPFQRPVIPPIAPRDERIRQIHSAHYYNPQQLPEGAVLVVGAGSSGVQIADELQRAGRQVYLSVGAHDRPPRSYRNRDFCWWLGVLGEWDAEVAKPGREHVTIAVSGARGGHTVDFRALAHQGVTLVGLTESFVDGVATFRPDLAENLARGDENYLALLDAADAYIARNGLDLPEEPEARRRLPDPQCVTDPILELDLAEAGVGSIIWPPAMPSTSAGCRSMPSTATASRATSVACPANPACISSACPGCRGAAPRSSGASGTTRAMSPTTSPSSASTSHTATLPSARNRTAPRKLRKPASRKSADAYPYPHSHVQHQGHLPQPVPGQRSLPGRARRQHGVRARPGRHRLRRQPGRLGDPRAQAEQAMKNVKQLLEEAGSDLSHIVKTTTYLIDPRYREPVYREVGKWLKGVFPISTGLVVSALGQPQC